MREFRLKKWYPSLPENWKGKDIYVVEREHGFELHPCVKDCVVTETIRFREVYNNDFWEEVVPVKQKDYEVLSFLRTSSKAKGCFKLRKPNGKFGWSLTDTENTEEELLSKTGFDIYSVKRTSDGKIFTVGDSIDSLGEKVKIKKFIFTDIMKGLVIKSVDGLKGKVHLTKLEVAKELKPLFKTEDGVEIFEGDIVYYVELDDGEYSWTIQNRKVTNRDTRFIEKHKDVVVYKNERKAEDFIIRNKPVLSMSEVNELIKPYLRFEQIKAYSTLKKAIKEKLGL